MKITFPHLGPVHLVLRPVFREMGIETVVPSVNTPEVLEKGKKLAPEEMCLPFKYMLGNLMEAWEKGAQKVIMPATIGPCRLGEYGELLKSIMDCNGYPMQWTLLDTPKAIGVNRFLKRVKSAGSEKQVSDAKAVGILLRGMDLMKKLDSLEAEIKRKAGTVQAPENCIKLIRSLRSKMESAQTVDDALEIIRSTRELLDALPKKRESLPINILVTGEIYTLIESAANQQLEEKLMRLGCSAARSVTVSWWLRRSLLGNLPDLFGKNPEYMPYSIGGFAKETVRETACSRERGYDGVIKIMPTGCMPEIVAKSVCDRISEEKGTKILHLVFDEMTGAAGYDTRIEAFVDMLERRKNVFPRN